MRDTQDSWADDGRPFFFDLRSARSRPTIEISKSLHFFEDGSGNPRLTRPRNWYLLLLSRVEQGSSKNKTPPPVEGPLITGSLFLPHRCGPCALLAARSPATALPVASGESVRPDRKKKAAKVENAGLAVLRFDREPVRCPWDAAVRRTKQTGPGGVSAGRALRN